MANFMMNEEARLACGDILGYLNFSSGSRDVRFISAWNSLYKIGADCENFHLVALDALRGELAELEKTQDVFRDSRQARIILDCVAKVLPAYRAYHVDALFHQSDSYLFNSFFMARLCRLTAERLAVEPNASVDYIVGAVVRAASDFLGYRPIPVLEGREKHEPHSHEWTGVLPLYLRGVGCAAGKYSVIVEHALEIWRSTPPKLLRVAGLDLEKLDEFSIDPRAYDFDHPVNRRPNYSFGTWDDRSVDEDGFYRRFIVHQATVDSMARRYWNAETPELRAQYAYETGAVLAGTVLMSSAVSGGCVQAYDSTMSVGELMQIIARLRDEFYAVLIKRAPEEFREALEADAKLQMRPFGSARQNLNFVLAKKRADQLQRFAMARTYAHMGYFDAAREQAAIIETPSARLLSRIDSLITKAYLSADAGKVAEAAPLTSEIEELLRRGISCGAFPDPWTIIGFGGQFTAFQSIDSVSRDNRIDSFIDLLNDIFDLYSRLQKEAAAA
ncbi:MAG: hypothetical protein HUK22_02150, partial [Thermoguttaceae bacterium]|nr:hypothetical protein [Thermoguttaceae bacterium]